MKQKLFISLFLICLICINITGAISIIRTETLYASPFSWIGLDDTLQKIYYSDGTTEIVSTRAQVSLLIINSYTKVINIEYGKVSDIKLDMTLQGYSCMMTIYDNIQRVKIYDTNTNTLIGEIGTTFVGCEQYVPVSIVIPGSLLSDWFLQPGEHKISLVSEARFEYKWSSSGTAYTSIITSTPTTGKAILSSIPSGANIFVDNTYVGISPIEINLAGGNHEIRVVMIGYKTNVHTISIINGQTITDETTLIIDTIPTPTPTPTPIPILYRYCVGTGCSTDVFYNVLTYDEISCGATYWTGNNVIGWTYIGIKSCPTPTPTPIIPQYCPTYVAPPTSCPVGSNLIVPTYDSKLGCIPPRYCTPTTTCDSIDCMIKLLPGFELIFAILGISAIYVMRKK